MDGNNILVNDMIPGNETLGDTTPIGQESRSYENIQDSPNEEVPTGLGINGDTSSMEVSDGDKITDPILHAYNEIMVSSNAQTADKNKENTETFTVTPTPEASPNIYNLDDIYQLLGECREIQQESLKALDYGSKLLKASNSIGISAIFAISLVLGVLIGRVVWRKL